MSPCPACRASSRDEVEVDPAQRERTAPVVQDQLVEPHPRDRGVGVGPGGGVPREDGGDRVVVVEHEALVGSGRDAELGPRPALDGLAEPDPLDERRVLDQSEQRRGRRHQSRPGLLLGEPVEQGDDLVAGVVDEREHLVALGAGVVLVGAAHARRLSLRCGV